MLVDRTEDRRQSKIFHSNTRTRTEVSDEQEVFTSELNNSQCSEVSQGPLGAF